MACPNTLTTSCRMLQLMKLAGERQAKVEDLGKASLVLGVLVAV